LSNGDFYELRRAAPRRALIIDIRHFAPMSWSLEAFHEWLQGEYSVLLYGGAHRLPVLDDLKLVWLRLLD